MPDFAKMSDDERGKYAARGATLNDELRADLDRVPSRGVASCASHDERRQGRVCQAVAATGSVTMALSLTCAILSSVM